MVNWKWAIFQLIFAILCVLFLNRQRHRLNPVTEESIRNAANATFASKNEGIDLSEKRTAAYTHLWNAFNYWKEPGKIKEKDATYADMLYVAGADKLKYTTNETEDYYRYPLKKKYMKASLDEFNKALQIGCTEPDVIEELNLYVRCYNAAHKRIYDGKWWIIAIAIACVYIHGLVPSISLGILNTDQYAAFPDGFFPQIGYLTKYLLPGVLFSTIAYCATSFAVRYQNRRGQYVMPSELKNDINLKDVATYAGKPLLGALAALGAVGLGVAAAIYGMVNAVGTAKMDKVTYKSAQSGRVLRTGSELSAVGMGNIMFAFFAFAAVLLAVYFISSIVLSLFSLIFIYNAIKNYIVRT